MIFCFVQLFLVVTATIMQQSLAIVGAIRYLKVCVRVSQWKNNTLIQHSLSLKLLRKWRECKSVQRNRFAIMAHDI